MGWVETSVGQKLKIKDGQPVKLRFLSAMDQVPCISRLGKPQDIVQKNRPN